MMVVDFLFSALANSGEWIDDREVIKIDAQLIFSLRICCYI